MKRSAIVVAGLSVALVASNAWWAYRSLDFGITYTYQQASLDEASQALSQSLAIIDALARDPHATREQLVEVAAGAWSSGDPFEKDGYVWVGRLGLEFQPDGAFAGAVLGTQ